MPNLHAGQMSDFESGLTRRDFARFGCLGVGAAVAANSIGVAATRVHAATATIDANSRVVLAVMGVNGRGAALAQAFAKIPGCEIKYVCDVDSVAADRCVERLVAAGSPRPTAIGDFRRALDDRDVHALVVATPDHWHGPATILACAAGKHVYVEKPACHNPREGQWMVAAAAKYDRVVQMGTQRRSSQSICDAIGELRSGALGRVLFSRGWINGNRTPIGRGQAKTPPATLDYSLWQGPAPERPYRDNVVHYHWHWFWHWGTGELGNNGVHGLDLCRWGLGVDFPKQVTCGGGKYFFDDDQETPDTQLVAFDFGDKAIHWEHRTWHKRTPEGPSFGASFYGEKGAMLIEQNQVSWFDADNRLTRKVECGGGETEHLANFVEAVRGDARLNQPIVEGYRSTLLCLLGNIAWRTRSAVTIDDAGEKIIGSPEQQALWSREYRAGWEPVV